MVVRVASTNAVVEPDTVSLIAIRTFVARLTMLGARWLDHFAVGAKFRAWQLLEKLIELHRFFVFLEQTIFAFLGSLVSLDVAWLRAQAEVPGHEELDANH